MSLVQIVGCSLAFFFRILSHFYVGSMILMGRLHLTRSCTSSTDNSLSDKSFLMLSNHIRFGFPLLLVPGSSVIIKLLPTYSSHTTQTYFPALSWICLSFLILSSLVTPLIHLNILVLSSLPTTRHHISLLVLQPSCILDRQAYSSVTQNPRYPLPVFPSRLYSMRHLRIEVSILRY